jgi:hypothetical protein
MVIVKLKRHKMSPGIDQIPSEMIKAGGREIRSEVHKVIISIRNKKELPEERKESIIGPIYKKSDKTDCSNYIGMSFIGLDWTEINAGKTKYLVLPGDQNEGRIYNTKTDNSSFETVEVFKHLGTTLMYQNYIQEEIKSSLKSGKACHQ